MVRGLALSAVVVASLLNPEVFHLKGGSTKFSETEQSNAAKHYRQSLMSLAAWKKLFSGKANNQSLALTQTPVLLENSSR